MNDRSTGKRNIVWTEDIEKTRRISVKRIVYVRWIQVNEFYNGTLSFSSNRHPWKHEMSRSKVWTPVALTREILKSRRVFRVPRRNSIKSLLSSPHPFPCLFLGRLVLLVARASVCNEWRQTGMTAGLSASQIELFYLSRSRNRPRPVHVLLCIYCYIHRRGYEEEGHHRSRKRMWNF